MDILSIGKAIVQPLAGWANKRTERKVNRDTIKGKLAQGKQDDSHAVTLTDAEWETVGQSMQDKTWKDEYVTVSIVSIFNLLIIGGIATAFGYPQMLDGTVAGIAALVEAGVDVGMLITAVVFAAIGMKLWRL